MKSKKIKKHSKAVEGQFPLNPSNSDRLTFNATFDDKVFIISNVSYEMLFDQRWEWIIRYDDHGGTEDFHRHERYCLEDESDFPSSNIFVPDITKKKLFEWAINDIKRNYMIYRTKFCKRNSIDLY